MVESRRSSTLYGVRNTYVDVAGDGRESPLKYTTAESTAMTPERWGWSRVAAQVHCVSPAATEPSLGMAGSRRSSTLAVANGRYLDAAGDGRESPLKYTFHAQSSGPASCWGWPGIAAQVHSCSSAVSPGMSWGWPGVAAQVHYSALLSRRRQRWGWPGIAAQVHYAIGLAIQKRQAGDGRESPLKYTDCAGCPGAAVAGDGRESPLKYT